MSLQDSVQRPVEPESVEICEFCGLPIEEDGQQCPALDDGRCQV